MSWEIEERVYRRIAEPTPSRIVFLVLDGLGDIPGPGGLTPLEAAATPNLDRLAAEGVCGLFDPVAPGITPGSGPGHLGLFGYEPLEVEVGRGVLAALGIGFPLREGDVAARFNFCTLDGRGRIVDRRAGRLSTARNRELVARLREAVPPPGPGVELHLETVSEHRGLLVLRGEGLGSRVADTDPQRTGVPPREPVALEPGSERTAELLRTVLTGVRETLAGEPDANGILLRGFDSPPRIPDLRSRFGLRPWCLARYPMYRGLARLVGMELGEPYETVEEIPGRLAAAWEGHDFFFCHVKDTDKAGEDGDFARKRRAVERVDALVPALLELGPEVVVVTADHSTPVPMASHSWHPVPGLIWAPGRARRDAVTAFGEAQCAAGGLGRMRLRHLLPLALAHAGKLGKFGA